MDAMDWSARFDANGSLATITVTGTAYVDGFRKYLDGVLSDPAWRRGMPVLVDFQDFHTGHLSYGEVEDIVRLHGPYMTRIGNSPVAVVVSRPVDFGMVRMWEALASQMFPVHEVFYKTDDAMSWLHSHCNDEARSLES